jgi:hypothetical protein
VERAELAVQRYSKAVGGPLVAWLVCILVAPEHRMLTGRMHARCRAGAAFLAGLPRPDLPVRRLYGREAPSIRRWRCHRSIRDYGVANHGGKQAKLLVMRAAVERSRAGFWLCAYILSWSWSCPSGVQGYFLRHTNAYLAALALVTGPNAFGHLVGPVLTALGMWNASKHRGTTPDRPADAAPS